MWLKIYELDPEKSFSGLAWPSALKKAKVKLELLNKIDMLLMVEKGIRGELCHSINRYTKANNKWKIMMNIKNLHILNIRMWIICLKV